MASANTLTTMARLILSTVESFESSYTNSFSSTFPCLDIPDCSPLGENLDLSPAQQQMRLAIVATAAQLVATVDPVHETLMKMSMGMYSSAALQFADEVNIANILKDAGTKGLHVDEIAKAAGVKDSPKIARFLRYLATRHIFKEVSPDIFANNRISSAMLKAKSLDEIKAESTGLLQASAYMSKFASDADDKDDTGSSPFSIAHGISYWEWFGQSGNEMLFRRFSEMMKVANARADSATFLTGFDWKSVEPDSVVVDVGAGAGQVTLLLARTNTHLRFVVQDLPSVIETDALAYWSAEAPDFIESNKVELQGHDFFTPQPVKEAAVYILRFVLHNWPQSKSVAIMRNLRSAAGPLSKLVLFELCVPYACHGPDGSEVVSSSQHCAGVIGCEPTPCQVIDPYPTALDMLVLNAFNGQERTMKEFRELGELGGWKFESMVPGPIVAITYSIA